MARSVYSTVFLALLGIATRAEGQNLAVVPAPPLGQACDDLDVAALAGAIEKELPLLARSQETFQFGARRVTAKDYSSRTLAPLAQLARQGNAALCSELPKRFEFYRNADAGPGKFTAYHNPLFRGSRAKTAVYRYPLYRRPGGPQALLPTADYLKGALDGKGLELVYLADATEVLAAHVEGSATVLLDDGTTFNVGSDGHNGQPYTNVSKLLLADHRIPKDQVTPLGMTRARKYFIDHPAELPVYWAKNPHYVFFKESAHQGGGKFGELVPGRSIAVDPAAIPLGVAVWMRSDKPAIADNKITAWVSFGRVALAQDTGAGIRGTGRVDVFFGTGAYAEQAAAVTTRPGEIYALLAR